MLTAPKTVSWTICTLNFLTHSALVMPCASFANKLYPYLSSESFDLGMLYFAYTVEPVNNDHMTVNKCGRYRQVVTQYRSKVILKAPTGAFSITLDLYKATTYHKIMFFYGCLKQVSLFVIFCSLTVHGLAETIGRAGMTASLTGTGTVHSDPSPTGRRENNAEPTENQTTTGTVITCKPISS